MFLAICSRQSLTGWLVDVDVEINTIASKLLHSVYLLSGSNKGQLAKIFADRFCQKLSAYL